MTERRRGEEDEKIEGENNLYFVVIFSYQYFYYMYDVNFKWMKESS